MTKEVGPFFRSGKAALNLHLYGTAEAVPYKEFHVPRFAGTTQALKSVPPRRQYARL